MDVVFFCVDGVGARESLIELVTRVASPHVENRAALHPALHAQNCHGAHLLPLRCVHGVPPTAAVRNSPRLPFARLRTCPEGSTQDLTEPRANASTRPTAMSSTAKLFSSPGFGHIDPSVERGQLRKEIDAAMNRVDKLLKNTSIEAAERIQRIEDLKDEINQKKARIAEIKAAARDASRAPTPPATPRELAPVAPPGSRSPRPVPVRVGPPGHTQPWSPDRAKALKT